MNTVFNKQSADTNVWQGGRTKEIFIYPENSKYADRNFLFRISTSTVELSESDFTVLPNYTRKIAVIDGEMYLTHDDGTAPCRLVPMETVHTFDGGANTHCVGKCTDVNLMIAKGKAEGDLRFADANETLQMKLSAGEFCIIYGLTSGKTAYVTDGEAELKFDERTVVFTVRVIEGLRE